MSRPAAPREPGAAAAGRSWERPPGSPPTSDPAPAPARTAADQARVARLEAAAGLVLVVLLAVLLAVWGAFLVPFRVGDAVVPVSWAVVVVGNVGLGLAAGRLGGRLVAALPGVVWLVIAMALGSRRREGDLVVDGSLVGMGYLALGAIAAAVTYAVVAARPDSSRSDSFRSGSATP